METKGYDNTLDIPQDEKNKITAGEKFFEAVQQKYPAINIKFKTKINNEELAQIINEVLNTPVLPQGLSNE